ncbi:peroxidase family protein [Crocosphaera sp.]|uniref:peroxidase family protein n=1 Tax=Crocosphaera sp. TaxID=2729996 RepID=UPI0026154130|nr:peroxidase family protein [Crocosphaera sp.]MDJ0580088.1 peroxidase family protein [Crocosphaera sp.]
MIDDIFENNDILDDAFNLSRDEQTLLSELGGPGVSLDDDFYRIRVTPGSLDLSIELFFDHEQGNLDLFLFDRKGNQIASSTSLNDNEIFNVTVAEAGRYFIKVGSGEVDSSGNPVFSGNNYDLRWNDVISENNFRTFNGLNNNLLNPLYGEEGIQLLRLSPAAYEDGYSEARGGGIDTPLTLPSARAISNAIADQGEVSIPNSFDLSDWFWQWGQFIDHDLGLTEAVPMGEPFDIPVPAGDPDFDPNNTGTQVIPLTRAIFDPDTGFDPGDGSANPRQQINEITAFLDGSMVYGSNATTAASLRANDGTGRMATSIGNNGEELLPVDADGNFMAGDVRVNEQFGLISVHTLFVREHNRLADRMGRILDRGNGNRFRRLNNLFQESELSRGDFIYESARRLVGAKVQIITYNEFLPLLLDDDVIADYEGYDNTVNPGIFTEFSTGLFRFGHTMLSPQLLQVDDAGNVDSVALRDAFFNPSAIVAGGVDSFLRGLELQEAQELDTQLVDDVRNFLFGPPGAGGFDLASLNIQRGRETGVADLNTVRESLGLDAYESFDELTGGDTALADKFESVYDSIDDVDLWIGGLAEQQFGDSIVGETMNAIIGLQFSNLRDGDRFFYENDEYLDRLAGIVDKRLENTSLDKIIEANSGVDITGSAFIVPENLPV